MKECTKIVQDNQKITFFDLSDVNPSIKNSYNLINVCVYNDIFLAFDDPSNSPEAQSDIQHRFIRIPCEWFEQMKNNQWHLHKDIEVIKIGFSMGDPKFINEAKNFDEEVKDILLTVWPDNRDQVGNLFNQLESSLCKDIAEGNHTEDEKKKDKENNTEDDKEHEYNVTYLDTPSNRLIRLFRR